MDTHGASDILSLPAQESSVSEVGKCNPWGWQKMGLVACGLLGGLSGASLLWLLSIPPAPNCQQFSMLTSDMERLYCAQEAARSGDLSKVLSGLKTLSEWTPDRPLYPESQRLMAEWSTSVLNTAQQKVEQSDLHGGIELAQKIPKNSPVYKDAQRLVADWRDVWEEAESIYADAQKAMQQQNWNRATEQISQLRLLNDDYWRSQQANALTQQLLEEQKARKAYTQAKQMAQSGQIPDLVGAVNQISNIRRNTYTWADLQPDLRQWSEKLLATSFQLWRKGHMDESIILAQQAGLNPKLTRDAEHLTWLGQARKLAASSYSNWQATPAQVLQLMTATTLANLVPADSRFYQVAQTSLKVWRNQLQDAGQLQIAQLAANLKHPFTLQFAINQAEQIAPARPRRLQAQTLVAHWKQEIQRLEDEPYLAYSRQLASQGTMPALKAAIAHASRIGQNRVLQKEAQSLIAGWNREIQILEDQPTLNAAQRLAREGRLDAAIQTASQIQSGRPLYWQAQAEIGNWVTSIRRSQMARRQAPQASNPFPKPAAPERIEDVQPVFPTLESSQDGSPPSAMPISTDAPIQTVETTPAELQPHSTPSQPPGQGIPRRISPETSPARPVGMPIPSAPTAIPATVVPTAPVNQPGPSVGNQTLPVTEELPPASSTITPLSQPEPPTATPMPQNP